MNKREQGVTTLPKVGRRLTEGRIKHDGMTSKIRPPSLRKPGCKLKIRALHLNFNKQSIGQRTQFKGRDL